MQKPSLVFFLLRCSLLCPQDLGHEGVSEDKGCLFGCSHKGYCMEYVGPSFGNSYVSYREQVAASMLVIVAAAAAAVMDWWWGRRRWRRRKLWMK